MTADAARVTAWVEELESLVPEARRGFMEDRAPEAAGFLVDAAPALLAIVRGVAELVDELDRITGARWSPELWDAQERLTRILSAAAPGAEEQQP